MTGAGLVMAVAVADAPQQAWVSGAWTGGYAQTSRIDAFGAWRGRPADTVLYFPERGTWDELRRSDWHVSTFNGFDGRLVYGIPLLPADGSSTLAQVAQGDHDEDFRKVARTLLRHNRGDAIVRIGWEANGKGWWPWSVDASEAPTYRAAFVRVVDVMRAEAPDLVIDFDISCGTGLTGSSDRVAALRELYPGDAHVDVIGCDVYDFWKTKATNEQEWTDAVRPKEVPGLMDVIDFAAEHDKKFSVPEWGLSSVANHGNGDNPFYIQKMHDLFAAHARSLAYEQYFNEPDPYILSSLWSTDENPRSSVLYAALW